MTLINAKAILAMGPQPQPGQPAPPLWTNVVPLVLLVVVFYFALIRPQQKKQKEHAELLKAVRPGDKIVTTGGGVGVILSVKEKNLSIPSADPKFRIIKT